MMNRLIIFLIRRKLKLKKYQQFKLKNQNSCTDRYYFTDDKLLKATKLTSDLRLSKKSNISLNFILSDECVELLEKFDNER